MVSTRFLPVLALLLAGPVSQATAAVPRAITCQLAAGPYDNDYDQGVASAVEYINNGQRPYDQAQAEKLWAEDKQNNNCSSIHEYYYLQGYIDRLQDYLDYGN